MLKNVVMLSLLVTFSCYARNNDSCGQEQRKVSELLSELYTQAKEKTKNFLSEDSRGQKVGIVLCGSVMVLGGAGTVRALFSFRPRPLKALKGLAMTAVGFWGMCLLESYSKNPLILTNNTLPASCVERYKKEHGVNDDQVPPYAGCDGALLVGQDLVKAMKAKYGAEWAKIKEYAERFINKRE